MAETRLITKICHYCEQSYSIDIRQSCNSQYCSPECKDKAFKKHYKESYVSQRIGKGSQKKTCTWCGTTFEVPEELRGKGQFRKCPECRKLKVRPLRSCIKCNKRIVTKKQASFEIYCPTCKQILLNYFIEKRIPREEQSRYRFCKECKEIFYDDNPSRNARKSLCLICKEKLDNKDKKRYEPKTCEFCGNIFTPRAYNQIYCSGCVQKSEREKQQLKRNKVCILCDSDFIDTTYKNSKNVCDSCEVKGFQSLIKKLKSYSPKYSKYKQKDLLNHLSQMRRDNSFYGRTGELIFLHLFPDSLDMNFEVSANHYFDMKHSLLGKVDVKTSLPGKINEMIRWRFHTAPSRKKDWDYVFCVGFSKDYESILRLWLVPWKHVTGKRCDIVTYDPATTTDPALLRFNQYDITSLYNLNDINKYLQKLLSVRPAWAYDVTKLKERSAIWKGRVGEIIFSKLHPMSEDMLVHTGNVNYAYDFEDPFLRRVDVKTTTLNYQDRFELKPQENTHLCDTYFVVGVDKEFTKIIALFSIPTTEVQDLKGNLKLKPNESPYDVTDQYDLSKINIQDIKNGIW